MANDNKRNWSIRACSAVKNEGLTEGLDWYGIAESKTDENRLVDIINQQHGK